MTNSSVDPSESLSLSLLSAARARTSPVYKQHFKQTVQTKSLRFKVQKQRQLNEQINAAEKVIKIKQINQLQLEVISIWRACRRTVCRRLSFNLAFLDSAAF